ncbi:Zinc finger protein 383 [Amphibalanus amphitrite]|uniref:Zinc finger protein 383 n=1 Tax=Amphibalanus amphitrite TaxID=1232801 RepID=A0A6A4VLS9_AMPAM|nr:Zinc finger protein 383 [Amphibalanus amphitrite]
MQVGKPRIASSGSPAGTPGLKPASRPGPSKAPVSLLKAGPLRMGLVSPSVSKAGPQRPSPSGATGLPKTSLAAPLKKFAAPAKLGLPRPGPPDSVSPRGQYAPVAGARHRAPSGGASRAAPDPFRPKPSASAPKPRMSWDLDLLTDGSPEDEGHFATDLEQSPTFLTSDQPSRPSRPPAVTGQLRTMGPIHDKVRNMQPKRPRGRPPKAPGEQSVPRKYVKKAHAANGAGGHAENVSILHSKPKWKGATDVLHNDFSTLKEKQRRRKEKLVAVRLDGSVPQKVTLLPRDPDEPYDSDSTASPVKDAPRPGLASPPRRSSGASEHAHGKPETKPLFEHIDEDWAVIKKSLENTEAKRERRVSEAGSSLKGTLTPSPTKKSDRSDELSTDEDIGNNLNAPLHNLERLQDQMIKSLMDDGALAALKKKHRKQKEVHMFKKKKMSDYWKSKLASGKSSLQMKMKRPYNVRPLTSDNVRHMEEAIAAVLAAPSPEASPQKRPPVGSPSKLKPPADWPPAGGASVSPQSRPKVQLMLHSLPPPPPALSPSQSGRAPEPARPAGAAAVRSPAAAAAGRTPASLCSGTVTDADIGGADGDDGLAPLPEPETPLPVSMSATKLKEFLDSARVSRYRRTCGSGLLAAVQMPVETAERMVFVSETPLPPGVDQTLVPNGQAPGGPGVSAVPGAGWPVEQVDPARGGAAWMAGPPASGLDWYGAPAGTPGWSGAITSPAATTTGWFGGVVSPAPGAAWTGLPTDGSVPATALFITPLTVPGASPAPVLVSVAPPSAPTIPSMAPPPPAPATPAPVTAPPATAAPSAAADDASDVSMEEKPLRIALPPTPSAGQAATPAGSAPRTPLSVSPPSAAPSEADRPQSGGRSVPGTPGGDSPRPAAASVQPSPPPPPPPVDPATLPFACNRCPARLATLSEQVYHEIRLHMTEEYLFRCMGCPMRVALVDDPTKILDGLLDHYMKHVDGAGRLLPYDSSTDFFRCEFCPRVFEDPSAYGSHEVQCRSLTHTCARCQARFETGDQLKWHEVDHLRAPDGKYCCDHCDSKFTKREQLLGHRRFHFKDKNVECPKCGKKFMTTGMLAMHNKWKHSQGPCRFCGRPFTSATARQAHEEHMHLKYMLHMCDVCHFRVMTATQLRVHKRTHSDDKPHRCAACDEAFVSRNLLKKHRASRHSEPRAAAEGAAPAPAAAEPEPAPAPLEPAASQGGGESARAPDGTLTPAELRQLFERYKATWSGPKDEMTLSDLDTDEDEDEKRDLIDMQAKEELFKTKDKNSLSVWSCPVCNAYFTKLWGVRAHITLKHPGSSMRPVLHDDKDTSASSKQDFLKEIKRNAKTAKRELKMEAKRQARIAAYGDELPRRGRPRKYPVKIRPPIDPSQPRKRGRPRKNPDDPTAPPPLAEDGAAPPPPAPPKPEPKPEPPPDHVERRRWKCLTCQDQSQSYDDLVTHTYLAHPDADLPRFEVVVTYVPKPVPKTPAEPATPPPAADAASESDAQEKHDADILDSARVRGAEKRRAPSATKVPAGAKRRSIP